MMPLSTTSIFRSVLLQTLLPWQQNIFFKRIFLMQSKMGLILYFKMQQFWLLLHHFNTKNQFRIRKKEENVCLGVWDDVTILSNLKIKKLIDPNLKVTQHAYLFQSHQVWRNGFHITMGWGTQKMWPKFKTKGYLIILAI